MKSEDLDRRITIQRGTPVRDDLNNEVLAWTDLVALSASRRAASTNERLAQQEVGADFEQVFATRWSPTAATINPKDRLVFDGRIYDIVSATEIGRRDGILIKATARAE